MHYLIQLWFEFVRDHGYAGVFLLMAAESSILPVPSEVVMPPAAYWAAQGHMSFWGVVLAGTLGSWFGSAVSYWLALWIGRPLVMRYGKYLLMPPKKIELAEGWAQRNGLKGVFVARLLPVVRHLISIPAGILRMKFVPFSIVTTVGAGIWCYILAWWGMKVLGDQPKLIEDPDAMVKVMQEKMIWFVGAIVVLAVLFVFATRKKKQQPDEAPPAAAA
ncbi:MAG TPA: DedA family protein [Planctomycetota bacterium]|nr:DedA family protein [Planctomycetota bacterium]